MFLGFLLFLPLLGQAAVPATVPVAPAADPHGSTVTASVAPAGSGAEFAQAQTLIDHGKFDEGIAQLRQLRARGVWLQDR